MLLANLTPSARSCSCRLVLNTSHSQYSGIVLLLRIAIYYFRLALATTATDWYFRFGTATVDCHLLLLDATLHYVLVIDTVNSV